MDLNGIIRNHGSILESGTASFVWNPDGTLASKSLSVGIDLIYVKTFSWNADGTLQSWTLTVQTTGEVITKTFSWNADGTLSSCTTI